MMLKTQPLRFSTERTTGSKSGEDIASVLYTNQAVVALAVVAHRNDSVK